MTIQSVPWIRIALWCLCAVPPAVAAWTTYHFTVFVPSDHFFDFLPLTESIVKKGYPTASVLFTGINEHIVLSFNLMFSFFGMLHPALLPPTKASLIFYTILTHLSILCTAFFIQRLAERTHTALPVWQRMLLLFTAIVILFSPVPWISWVQPYVSFTLIVTLAVAVLFILFVKPHSWMALMGAAGLAVFASFGLTFGFAIWPAALPVLLTHTPKRWKYLPLTVWIATGLLCVLIFLTTRLQYHQDLEQFVPWKFFTFTMILLGSSLSEDWFRTGIFGGILCCVLLLSLWRVRRSVKQASPWIGVVIFGVTCALLIAFGRASFGDMYGLQARYVIFTCIPWIGTVYLLALSKSKWLLAVFVVCILYLHLGSWPRMMPRFENWRIGQAQAERCFQYYKTAPDTCLAVLSFGPTYADIVRNGAAKMEELGLFTPDPSVQPDSVTGW